MALSCSNKSSALSNGITSKHKGDFCCLNCLYSFQTENKLKSREKVCKNKYFGGIVLPTQKNNTIEFNQYTKPDKIPDLIFADIETLIKK